MTEEQLVRQYRSQKDLYDQLCHDKSEAELELKRIRAELVDHMIDRNIKATARYEGIGFASLVPDSRPKCPNEFKDDFHDWLRQQGREDIISHNVHWKTLKTFVNECLEMDEELPDYLETNGDMSIRLNKE